jgi:hypothetical protein
VTPLERYTAAVELAIKLPTPQSISRTILADTPDVDDGLRAASYDGDRTTGGTTSSHPERMLAQRHPGQFPRDEDDPDTPGTWGPRHHSNRPADDLLRLSKASERAVEAIASLLAEVLDQGYDPDSYDWDDATKDAHLIAEHRNGETLRAALDLGRNVTYWLDRYSHAIDTVRAVHDTWLPHAPAQGLAEANQPWCRPCQRIKLYNGEPLLRQRVTKVCCQRCWRDIQDLEGFVLDANGHPIPAVELQNDPAMWPSEAMTKAREDGRRVLADRERQAWLRGHGADVSEVQRRRQERRAC